MTEPTPSTKRPPYWTLVLIILATFTIPIAAITPFGVEHRSRAAAFRVKCDAAGGQVIRTTTTMYCVSDVKFVEE